MHCYVVPESQAMDDSANKLSHGDFLRELVFARFRVVDGRGQLFANPYWRQSADHIESLLRLKETFGPLTTLEAKRVIVISDDNDWSRLAEASQQALDNAPADVQTAAARHALTIMRAKQEKIETKPAADEATKPSGASASAAS